MAGGNVASGLLHSSNNWTRFLWDNSQNQERKKFPYPMSDKPRFWETEDIPVWP